MVCFARVRLPAISAPFLVGKVMWAHGCPCSRTIVTLFTTLMRVGGHGGGYGTLRLVLYCIRAREGY